VHGDERADAISNQALHRHRRISSELRPPVLKMNSTTAALNRFRKNVRGSDQSWWLLFEGSKLTTITPPPSTAISRYPNHTGYPSRTVGWGAALPGGRGGPDGVLVPPGVSTPPPWANAGSDQRQRIKTSTSGRTAHRNWESFNRMISAYGGGAPAASRKPRPW